MRQPERKINPPIYQYGLAPIFPRRQVDRPPGFPVPYWRRSDGRRTGAPPLPVSHDEQALPEDGRWPHLAPPPLAAIDHPTGAPNPILPRETAISTREIRRRSRDAARCRR